MGYDIINLESGEDSNGKKEVKKKHKKTIVI